MKADAIKCQALPLDCVSFLLRVDRNSAACRGAGLNLISMLMVLTNVLWWRCHFWVDLNSASGLNCTVNYHIIAFSAVIYVCGEAGVHRGISAAAPTWRSVGWFSAANIHLYQHPSAPLPPHAPFFFIHLFLLLWLLSFSHSLCFTLCSPAGWAFTSSFVVSIFNHPSQRCLKEGSSEDGLHPSGHHEHILLSVSVFLSLLRNILVQCDLRWAKQELVLLLAKAHLDTLEYRWKDLLFL